jgi:DNA polymerase III gamma/tau subunit
MSDYQSITTKYRPQSFDEIVGHEQQIAALKRVIASPTHSHCYLLTGPSGCGKTTIARLIGNAFETTITEIDAASRSGVDDMRELIDLSRHMALGGTGKRLFLIDECFDGKSIVYTPTGPKRLDSIREGDFVIGAQGARRVKKVFINPVSISRIVRVNFASGKNITCSKDHAFLSSKGWQEAGDVKSVFTIQSSIPPQLLEMWDTVYEQRRGCSLLRSVYDKSMSERTQAFDQSKTGSSERDKTNQPGMDYVTSVQRGCDAASAANLKTYKIDGVEYADMIDLEMDGHPSYNVEELLVHNCHALSKNAWQAILKLTEEPPAHVYIALCTTEADKVPATITNQRAYPVVLRKLPNNMIADFMGVICELEEWQVNNDVFGAIVLGADGSPRKSLTLLAALWDAQTREDVNRVVSLGHAGEPLIAIIQALMQGTGVAWERISPFLERIEDDQFESAMVQAGRYIIGALNKEKNGAKAQKLFTLLNALTFPTDTFDKKLAFYAALGRMWMEGK